MKNNRFNNLWKRSLLVMLVLVFTAYLETNIDFYGTIENCADFGDPTIRMGAIRGLERFAGEQPQSLRILLWISESNTDYQERLLIQIIENMAIEFPPKNSP